MGNRPYQSVRYLEDYSALATAPSTDVWDPLKYVALWPGGYLSLGGQHRLRYELVSPTNAGIAPDATVESVMLSRNLLHLDLHLAPQLRVFAQLGAYYALGAPTRQDTPTSITSTSRSSSWKLAPSSEAYSSSPAPAARRCLWARRAG